MRKMIFCSVAAAIALGRGATANASATSADTVVSTPNQTGPNITFIGRRPAAEASAKGLHFAPDPPNAREIVANGLKDAEQQTVLLPRVYPDGPVHFSEVEVDPLVAVYGIADMQRFLTSGNLDAEAALSAYEYYFKSAGGKNGVVYARVYQPSGAVEWGGGRLNPTAEIPDAIHQASLLPQVQAGSYEARLLLFRWRSGPGENTVLWLKSAPGGADLIYTFQGQDNNYSMAELKAGPLYTVPDFLAAFQVADQRMKAEDAARKAATDAKIAAIVAENQRKVTNGEDTTTTRLKTLQASLATALANLKQAPTGYFDKAIADIIRAQDDVARGLDYVKAHPQDDPLLMRKISGSSPQWRPSNLVLSPFTFNDGYSPTHMLISPQSHTGSVGSTYLPAADGIIISLMDFLGNQTIGRPLLGDLGGDRDLIMRDVATASTDFLSKMHPDGIGVVQAPAIAPSHPGSISGLVVMQAAPGDSSGGPAAHVMVTFEVVASLDSRGSVASAIPGAITDESGAFVIQNVAPGFYALNTGYKSVVVEVKAGTETKLPTPLILTGPGFNNAGGG